MIEALHPFLPENSAPFVEELLKPHAFTLRVVKPRKTKLGDFRPGLNGKVHQITVNGDLSPYHFLLTLVHEIAHLKTHEEFGTKVQPHGKEWKNIFKKSMTPILKSEVYPNHIQREVMRYLQNPKASCAADTALLRVLKNEESNAVLLLEHLPQNALFVLPGRSPMRKGKKRRTRFLCEEVGTGRNFAVHPLAEVQLIQTKQR